MIGPLLLGEEGEVGAAHELVGLAGLEIVGEALDEGPNQVRIERRLSLGGN